MAVAATGDVLGLLGDCINKLNHNTAQPESFLSLQDAAAADFTSLAKSLYDLNKTQESADRQGGTLAELVVDSFDEEQVWQMLELQNTVVLTHFEEAAEDETLTLIHEEEEEEEEEGDGEEEAAEDDGEEEQEEEEEEETPAKRRRRKAVKRQDEDSEEDSDLDFDVDELEKREKQKKSVVTAARKRLPEEPSEVDDRFFKLSEMESFLDDMDKQEGKEKEDGIDYFQDLPSDNEGETFNLEKPITAKKPKKSSLKSSRNLKYKDFFDPVDGEAPGTGGHHGDSMDEMQEDSEEDVGGEDEDEDEEEEEEDDSEDEEEGQSREGHKKVTFKLSAEEESEGEDITDIFGGKSSSEKEEHKSPFEKRQEKMAEKIRELEKVALSDKPWQLAGEATAQIRPENSILAENVDFDQTSRKAPAITEETTLQLEDIIKQRIKDQVFDDVVRKEKPKEEAFQYKKRLTLDHEKSKLSLAQIYEQEFIKQTQQKTEVEENPAHVEIKKMMDTLFLKLDALSNFHFTPKPAVPEIKVVSNLPSISMEEEKNKAGDVLGDSEKTMTDKKRQRRKMKKVKQVRIKEKERRQRLKDASGTEENKKLSKNQVAEKLKKITKGGKATILKDEGKDKALRSSQAFFSQLQDQVKSQIKDAKGQAAKKKKISAMLGGGFKAERLKVNLRLVINRLKLLEKKKTELAQKARKEIADYLSAGKDERARIRVEHIIREDYLVEAMEILELHCDLLLARFGLIQSMKELDPGLQESVSTLIWAAPRLQSEVAELKIVSDQLCAKYSKEYGKLCRTNQIGTVNDRLMHKLSVEAPPKILVERYLIEIAKNYNVPYEPDAMVRPEAFTGEESDLIDVDGENKPRGGGGGGGGGGFTAPGMGMGMPMPMPMPMPMHMPSAFNYPSKGAEPYGPPVGTYGEQFPMGGGLPPQLPSCPPTYESIDDLPVTPSVPSQAIAAPRGSKQIYDNNALPELPSVPDTLPSGSVGGHTTSSDDIDFDDLSRRFEELKKKT
ncbi:U3 small nucleolar ribonucleoprotein MPP10 [Merluccius polli]|uniref:IST1 homolog n=1 Tax=Merluccius polli TaxID=89951 RepID=A0AA47NC54_MERPO|nr:U3 small nucleolar ribonucleoprotein MPP10 [Merluccius polli]